MSTPAFKPRGKPFSNLHTFFNLQAGRRVLSYGAPFLDWLMCATNSVHTQIVGMPVIRGHWDVAEIRGGYRAPLTRRDASGAKDCRRQCRAWLENWPTASRSVPCRRALIEQGGDDNDVFFLLSGMLDVIVNGRRVAKRGPGDHVGEMATVQPSQKRSASVVAAEDSIVAQLAEPNFADMANRHPQMYRYVA